MHQKLKEFLALQLQRHLHAHLDNDKNQILRITITFTIMKTHLRKRLIDLWQPTYTIDVAVTTRLRDIGMADLHQEME